MNRVFSSAGFLVICLPAAVSAQAASVPDLLETVVDLQWTQCEIHRDYAEMPDQAGESRDGRLRDLRERKEAMRDTLEGVETRAGELASIGSTSEETVERLRAVFRHIRESRLGDMIQYSLGTIEQWDRESARKLETEIQDRLQGVRDRLDPAPQVVHCPEIAGGAQ